ncbi:MAG: hypothetical protein ABI706_19355 [Ilumatobacteraceae bacterium]
MAEETALGAAVRLTIAMETAAALAAYVRVTTESIEVDPKVRTLLEGITTAFRAASETLDALGERLRTPGSTFLDVRCVPSSGAVPSR